jgi:hypothetical protein
LPTAQVPPLDLLRGPVLLASMSARTNMEFACHTNSIELEQSTRQAVWVLNLLLL